MSEPTFPADPNSAGIESTYAAQPVAAEQPVAAFGPPFEPAPAPAYPPAAPAYAPEVPAAYPPAAPAPAYPPAYAPGYATPGYAAPASAIPASSVPSSAVPTSGPAGFGPAGYPAAGYGQPGYGQQAYGQPAYPPAGAYPTAAFPAGAAPAPKKKGRAATIVFATFAVLFLMSALGTSSLYVSKNKDLVSANDAKAASDKTNAATIANLQKELQVAQAASDAARIDNLTLSDKLKNNKACVVQAEVMINLPNSASNATVNADYDKLIKLCDVATASNS